MATSKDAILAACLQILGVSPTVNPDYDLTVRAALLRVLLSGLTISSGGVISTTQPISVPIDMTQATGTLAVGHGGTGLTTVAANRLLYASALDTIAALASANNGVLVTNGSGVPSISVTLPSGLTITAPIFSGSIGSDLLFTDATFDIGKTGATRPRDGFFSRNVVIGGTFTPSGNILADLLFTDATFDIGKTGATRPRDGFFSRNLTAGGALSVTGAISGGSYAGPVGIPLNRNVTPASNGTTVETTLMTYTLPAAKLAANGDSVRIRSVGVTAANGNTKTLRLYFGATVVATFAGTPNNLSWVVEAEVSRTGAATQTAFGSVEESTSGKNMTTSAPTETLSGSLVIKITGQSGTAGGDITANNFSVDFVPAA